MRRLLFVDDEPAALAAWRRRLDPLRSEWELHFVSSGPDALACLDRTPFHVILADLRMPGMDGATLLKAVQARHPHVVRFVLAGPEDQQLLIRSLGAAHQSLPKAADPATIKTAVDRACAVGDLLANESLRLLVSGMSALPSLPSLYRQLMAELQSPEASVERAGRIIAQDIGMATRILQVVNSAYFGLRCRVSSPAQAVALLGLDTVKALVLSLQVFSQFSDRPDAFFSPDLLWRHGLVTGLAARAIAQEEGAPPSVADDAFTAGLIHDVCALILSSNLPDRYREMLALAQERQLPEWQAELEVFGATHGDVGGYCLGIWGLSDAVVAAVAFHHGPSRGPDRAFGPLPAVHVADVAEEEDPSAVMDGPPVAEDEDYLTVCGLRDRLPIWRAICGRIARSRNPA